MLSPPANSRPPSNTPTLLLALPQTRLAAKVARPDLPVGAQHCCAICRGRASARLFVGARYIVPFFCSGGLTPPLECGGLTPLSLRRIAIRLFTPLVPRTQNHIRRLSVMQACKPAVRAKLHYEPNP